MLYIFELFSTAPPPPKSYKVKDIHVKEGFTSRITLDAGFLQGVVEGVYDIYDTRLTIENKMADFHVATVDVRHENIHATESTAEMEFGYMYECKIKVRLSLVLALNLFYIKLSGIFCHSQLSI